MLDTWTLTVLALMNSWRPISRLLRPCAISVQHLLLARGQGLRPVAARRTLRGRAAAR
jgi:hypothetical protein